MRGRTALAAAMVLMFAAVSAGCTASPPPPPPPPQNHTFTFSAWDYAFSVTNLSVNRGDNVTLIVTNNGTMAHDLTIGAPYHVHIHIMENTTGSGTFAASAAGTFEYSCSVPGHKELGMVGTLTVQ